MLTLILGAIVSWMLGVEFPAALVIGAMVALSSTACVLRILTDRAEIDSPYGRISLGILLIQDVAFVPLMLLVTVLTTGGTVAGVLWQLALAVASASLLIVVFYGLFNHVAPKLLKLKTWRRNRDLPILLAVVMAMGSAWAAHRLGLSPAMGAFVAGVLLAVSPFAVQIRADIEPLKTILITLFFAAVGMFGDVVWLVQHVGLVCGVVLAIVLGKGMLVAIVTRLSGGRTQFAIASAFCLAQVGEFSFVLATIARGDGAENSILSDTSFRAIVLATIISLLTTPYLIALAPHAGAWLERWLRRLRKSKTTDLQAGESQTVEPVGNEPGRRDSIFIIGFGPAGQRAAEDLISSHGDQLVVIDINLDNIEIAQRYGLAAYVGDATQTEILEHAGIQRANLVIITVPSPLTSRKLVHLVPPSRFRRDHFCTRSLPRASLATRACRRSRGSGRRRSGWSRIGGPSPGGTGRRRCRLTAVAPTPASNSVRSLHGLQALLRPRYLAEFIRYGQISDREAAWGPGRAFPAREPKSNRRQRIGAWSYGRRTRPQRCFLRFGIAFALATEHRITRLPLGGTCT